MLLYGGIGLLVAGIAFSLGFTQFAKSEEQAIQLKKQAPILAVVGAGMLVVRFLIG